MRQGKYSRPKMAAHRTKNKAKNGRAQDKEQGQKLGRAQDKKTRLWISRALFAFNDKPDYLAAFSGLSSSSLTSMARALALVVEVAVAI